MPFERLSPTVDEFHQLLTALTAPLVYISETDAPLEVHRVGQEKIGRNFSQAELLREFLPDEPTGEPFALQISAMESPHSRGTQRFFRYFLEKITIRPDDEVIVWEPAHRAAADQWRALFHAWFDHTVSRRLFRVRLSDGVTIRIYAVGRFLSAEFNPETNEIRTEAGDWFVVETFTVET